MPNNAKSSKFDSLTEYLRKLQCNNLNNVNNFIIANFKNEYGTINVHGIDTIFKKIKEYISEKKYLDISLKNKMLELFRDFRSEIENQKIFGSFENEDIITIKELRANLKYNERMKEILEITNKNYLFSKINVGSIIKNGRKIADKCKNVIISLSKLKEIFPKVSENIPALTILQAFMVKEIAEGYGLDVNVLNSGTKFLLNNIRNNLDSLNKSKINNNKNKNHDNDKLQEMLNINEIKKALESIEIKISNMLEKGNNKDSILTLANLLNFLKEKNKKMNIGMNQDLFNQIFTKEISEYCKNYFERQLKETNGLIFMNNYFNKCESLLKDFDFYINKKDWDIFDMEIKK